MRGRTLLRAAVLILVPLTVTAGPAAAASCAPPSAEHAFEELLEALADDSVAEGDAWRIADEQEADGRFETAETIRRLDGLATRELLVYDCAAGGFRTVSGEPTPGELEREGDPTGADDGPAPPPSPGPGSGDPETPGGTADGAPGAPASAGEAPEGSVADGTGEGPATGGGGGDAADPAGAPGSAARNGSVDTGGPVPADASGASVAVPAPPGAAGPGRWLRPLGVLLAAAVVAGAAGLAARRP